MKILASIIVGTNRPQNIEDFVKNIEQKSTFPEQVEIIFSVDTGDDKCINILKNLQTSSKVKIKYLEGVRKRGYFEANIHYNECLHLADPDSYFFAVFSDKLKIKTEGWDEKLKKYIHAFNDDLFRVRISDFRNIRYNLNIHDALVRPDNFAFHTRKFLEISGGWGDTWGPDTWVQGIVFFCELLGINDREIVASDIDLEKYRYSDSRGVTKTSFMLCSMAFWSFNFLSNSRITLHNFFRIALKIRLYIDNYYLLKTKSTYNFFYDNNGYIIIKDANNSVITATSLDYNNHNLVRKFIESEENFSQLSNTHIKSWKKEKLQKRIDKFNQTKNKLKKIILAFNIFILQVRVTKSEIFNSFKTSTTKPNPYRETISYTKIGLSYKDVIKIQSHSNQFTIEQNLNIEDAIQNKYDEDLKQANQIFPETLLNFLQQNHINKNILSLIDNRFAVKTLSKYLINNNISSEINWAQFYSEMAIYLMNCGLQDEASELFSLSLEKQYDDKTAIIYLQNLMYTSPQNYSDEKIYKITKDLMSKMMAQNAIERYQTYNNDLTSDKILNIGYVCHFFDNETSSNLLLPILESHNRSKVKIFIYSDQDPKITKSTTKSLADIWHDVFNLDDHQLCELIRKDKIDILIELNGFTVGHRYKVVNAKPAPIQVSFYNLSATSGVEGIDYVISTEDIKLDQNYYSEKIINKEGVYLTISPAIPKISDIPPFVNNGYMTFGSFGQIHKVSKEQIYLWAEILKEVPNSKFYFKSNRLNQEEVVLVFRKHFEDAGIEFYKRVIIEGFSNYDKLIKSYEKIDIALDTFPYAGGTTTSEALLCGVPVIHLTGERFCSQHGTNYLRYSNVEELICSNKEEFVEKAVELANDQDKIKWYRENLPTSVRASKKCDILNYTKELEDVYFKMWNNYIKENHEK